MGGPPRMAGSSKFLDQYTQKRADVAGLLAQGADAKANAYVAKKTAQGPSPESRPFNFGALAQGAAGLAKGLSTAFKPQTAAGAATDSSVNFDPYKLDFGHLDLQRAFGGDYPNSWSSTASFDMSGSIGGFSPEAFTYSNPISNFDFGLGNNFSSTAFGS